MAQVKTEVAKILEAGVMLPVEKKDGAVAPLPPTAYRPKTTFVILEYGLVQFRALPMGLITGSHAYQRYLEAFLRGFSGASSMDATAHQRRFFC
ncbi:hypothetical protein DFQ26_001260 [Actinomortierella ambigua]|nr:hypothetical protein DFQ26_001260 [Actinomortierella ambigua]